MRRLGVLAIWFGAAASSAFAADDSFPYAVTVGDQPVEMRSGPGTSFYVTGRLTPGTRIEVHRQDADGWLAIRPPGGSFSLVRRRQLEATDEPGMARVTENEAVCRVGSSVERAGYPVSQIRLRQGELVELLDPAGLDVAGGAEKWCRVAPPSGEFRWVQASDVQPAGKLDSAKNRLQGLMARITNSPPPAKGSDAPSASRPPAATNTPPLLQTSESPAEKPRVSPGAQPSSPATPATPASPPAPAVPERKEAAAPASTLLTRPPDTWKAAAAAPPTTDVPPPAKTAAPVPTLLASPPHTWKVAAAAPPTTDVPQPAKTAGPAPTLLAPPPTERIAVAPEKPAAAPPAPSPPDTWKVCADPAPQKADSAPPQQNAVSSRPPKKADPPPLGDTIRLQPEVPTPPTPAAVSAGSAAKSGAKALPAGRTAFSATKPASPPAPSASDSSTAWVSRTKVPNSELRRVEVELTKMVALETHAWRLTPLRQQVEAWSDRLETDADKTRARQLLMRIAEFEKLQDQFVRSAEGLSVALPVPAPASGDSPPVSALTGGAEVRYDGSGWLAPVHAATPTSPPYALLDSDGNVLQYVAPAPGLNLHRYLKKQVGIYGQRGFLQTLQKPYLTAERVIDLDRHVR